ncbi:MAG: hypothetical protein ACYDHN_06785 [Solirubrobacteraceae bacterium]
MIPSSALDDYAEIAFLGNGQALTLSGLQTAHHRVLTLLQDGDALKKLLLFFDGLMIFGLGPSTEADHHAPSEGFVSIQPQRSLHTGRDGQDLYADTQFPIDEIAGQLIEIGLLNCIDPRGLLAATQVERLLEVLIDLAVAGVKVNASRTGTPDFVPFEPGALGPLMSDDLLRWTVSELCGLGVAEVREFKDLIVFPGRTEPGFSVGATPVFVDRQLADAFSFASDQVIRTIAWESDIICSPLRMATPSGDGLPARRWSVADLAMLESEVAGIDVSSVSVSDIAGFRAEHASLRRRYVRELRRQAAHLEGLDQPSTAIAINDIQQELRESSADYRRYARDYFGPGPVSVVLGIGGTITSYLAGDPGSAAVSFAQALNSARRRDAGPSAYTYLFEARRRLL